MVLLHIKQNAQLQFLTECSAKESCEKVIEDVVRLYNAKLRAERLCGYIENGLVLYGPTRNPNERGLNLDDDVRKTIIASCCNSNNENGNNSGNDESKNYVYNEDPMGVRNGQSPSPLVATTIKRAVEELKAIVSSDRSEKKQILVYDEIKKAIDIIAAAITIAYPMGLPEHDPVRQAMEDNEDLSGQQASLDILPLQRGFVVMWWASKEMKGDVPLSKFVGSNEKTKIIVKLQKSGMGPPAREPAVSEKEQREMMAFYYKKQEEMKRLEQLDEHDIVSGSSSQWADGKSLKNSLQGLSISNNFKLL